MRTSFDIPAELLDEAKTLTGAKTKCQAVLIALSEAIARRKSVRILELRGSLTKDYDYRE